MLGIGEVLKRNKIRVEKNFDQKKIINSLALENYHLVLHDSDKTLDKQDNFLLPPHEKLNNTFKALRRSKLLLMGKERLYSPHLIITIALKKSTSLDLNYVMPCLSRFNKT